MGKAYDRVMESRKELTKQLISEMSQGELCWIKGWNSTGKRPYNPITKAIYKGGNRFRLMDLCQYFEHKKLKGYADFFNSSSSFCCGVI